MPAVSKEEEEKKGGEDDEQRELDKFGDDLMSKMMQEGSQNESNYVAEYNEVIAGISQICGQIMLKNKQPN